MATISRSLGMMAQKRPILMKLTLMRLEPTENL